MTTINLSDFIKLNRKSTNMFEFVLRDKTVQLQDLNVSIYEIIDLGESLVPYYDDCNCYEGFNSVVKVHIQPKAPDSEKKYDAKEILESVPLNKVDDIRLVLGGESVKLNSDRLINFKVNGTCCKFCCKKGTYFQKTYVNNSVQFNLYADIDGEGQVLFCSTKKDPTIKSNHRIDNMFTACEPCLRRIQKGGYR